MLHRDEMMFLKSSCAGLVRYLEDDRELGEGEEEVEAVASTEANLNDSAFSKDGVLDLES